MGDRVLSLDQPLVVGESERETQDLKFSAGRIRGRLVNRAGKPISNAFVELFSDAPESGVPEDEDSGFKRVDSAHTHDDGTFEFGPLAAANYRLTTGERSMTQEIGPISVGHDQSAALGDVVLDSETTIEVVALSPAGMPLEKAEIYAYRGGSIASAVGYALAETSEKGTANLEGLAPGSYMVVGMMAGLAPAILEEVEVPRNEPAAPLVLRFASGGSLDVEIHSPKGEPVPYTRPRIIDAEGRDVTLIYMMQAAATAGGGACDSEGRAHLDRILPGEYLIQASAGGKADERKVTITAGQTATVKLSIEIVESN